jgi:hypothetical protein
MARVRDPTIEDERDNVFMGRSHLVVLGAGASRAAFPDGDSNGKRLPLMSDFVETLALRSELVDWGVNPELNFEDIFSDIFDSGEAARIEFLQQRIREYFRSLQIGHRPTLYDHLVLSLRKNDFIASFNWDPLLLQAYRRNARFELPRLLFLHGNVEVGYCEKDRTAGNLGATCSKCQQPFTPSPLLYPIRKKDYAANNFIASQWEIFKKLLGHTFMVTVFGYSGPKTDQEALSAMSAAWGPTQNRELEQTCFITKQSREEVIKNFAAFIHSHHYEINLSFYDSWIARHPRRTGEAWWNQYLEVMFLPDNPLPKDADFPESWAFFEPFREPERQFELETQTRPPNTGE